MYPVVPSVTGNVETRRTPYTPDLRPLSIQELRTRSFDFRRVLHYDTNHVVEVVRVSQDRPVLIDLRGSYRRDEIHDPGEISSGP